METDRRKALAKRNAYILLRSRPRSESEIRKRLKLKGYDEPTVEACIADLKRAGDIDDRKFAKVWIDSRMYMNPAGDVVLRHELKEKGVSDSLIEEALATKSKDYDEYEVALKISQEKFERLRKLDRRKAAKRLYDFLLRRGFRYETVRRIVEEIRAQGQTAGVKGQENDTHEDR